MVSRLATMIPVIASMSSPVSSRLTRPHHCSARWALLRSKVGGVDLAREQCRLAAIFAADVVGYSHAAYERIYYSSLMPRTDLYTRLLETLD